MVEERTDSEEKIFIEYLQALVTANLYGLVYILTQKLYDYLINVLFPREHMMPGLDGYVCF